MEWKTVQNDILDTSWENNQTETLLETLDYDAQEISEEVSENYAEEIMEGSSKEDALEIVDHKIKKERPVEMTKNNQCVCHCSIHIEQLADEIKMLREQISASTYQQQEISDKLDIILHSIQVQQRQGDRPEKPACLPMKTIAEVEAFDEVDNDLYMAMVDYLRHLGGFTLKEAISIAFKETIIDSAAYNFTWLGRGETKSTPLYNKKIVQAIYDALSNSPHFPHPSRASFQAQMTETLRVAKQRHRNANKNKRKRPANLWTEEDSSGEKWGDDSDLEIDLNNAMILSMHEETSPISTDDCFSHEYGSSEKMDGEKHTKESPANDQQLVSFSCFKTPSDTTSLYSLPRQNYNCNESIVNLDEQEDDIRRESNQISKNHTLRTLLNRMLDDTIRKAKSLIKSKTSSSSLDWSDSSGSSTYNSLSEKLSNVRVNNSESPFSTSSESYGNENTTSSTDETNDTVENNYSFVNNESLLNGNPNCSNNLTTILELCEGSTFNSQIYFDSSGWSAKYMCKLRNLDTRKRRDQANFSKKILIGGNSKDQFTRVPYGDENHSGTVSSPDMTDLELFERTFNQEMSYSTDSLNWPLFDSNGLCKVKHYVDEKIVFSRVGNKYESNVSESSIDLESREHGNLNYFQSSKTPKNWYMVKEFPADCSNCHETLNDTCISEFFGEKLSFNNDTTGKSLSFSDIQ